MTSTRDRLIKVPRPWIPIREGTSPPAPVSEPEPTPAAEPLALQSARPIKRFSPNLGLVGLLRAATGINLTGGTWLLLVAADRVPCATRLCDVATLDGRQYAAGLIALAAGLLLASAIPFTAGLSRTGPVTTTLLLLIALLGLIAAIGMVLMAALVLSIVGLTLAAVIGILVGAIRGDLTR